jgi:hypothetical protein
MSTFIGHEQDKTIVEEYELCFSSLMKGSFSSTPSSPINSCP